MKISDTQILEGFKKTRGFFSWLIQMLFPIQYKTGNIPYAQASIDHEKRKICIRINICYSGDRQYINLCNEGIHQYWSRSIRLLDRLWHVDTTVNMCKDGLKFHLIKPENGDQRSHFCYPFRAAKVYYPSTGDGKMRYLAAHELGHAILTDSRGCWISGTHHGTSSIFSNKKDSAPNYPVFGEIDLMKYYHNAHQVALSAILQRNIASEDDVKALLYISKR